MQIDYGWLETILAPKMFIMCQFARHPKRFWSKTTILECKPNMCQIKVYILAIREETVQKQYIVRGMLQLH